MTAPSSSQQRRLQTVFWVSVVCFVASAWFTMSSTTGPPCGQWDGTRSSHLGYTKSLLLFLVPDLGFSFWFWRHREALRPHWRPFLITSAIILVVWSALDIFLANTFFIFPDPQSRIGIYGPGFTLGHSFLEGWALDIPLEEFLFYGLGSWFILLSYLFMSEVWFKAYSFSPGAYEEALKQVTCVSVLSWKPAAWGLCAFGAAYAYKKYGSSVPEGFPGYAAFLIGAVAVPSALFHRVVGSLINLQGFVLMSLSLSMVSLLWEVTLALPYGWWDYRPMGMTGIFLTPWSCLPIEASLLWLGAAWSNVTLYETVRIVCRSDYSWRQLLFPRRAGRGGPDAPSR